MTVTLRLAFHQPKRQTEGLIVHFLGDDAYDDAPTYRLLKQRRQACLCRRSSCRREGRGKVSPNPRIRPASGTGMSRRSRTEEV